MWTRLKRWLLGTPAREDPPVHRVSRQVLDNVVAQRVSLLDDEGLVTLVELVLTTPMMRKALHGNERFLRSVAMQYRKKRCLSPRQRRGVLNVLERAYGHNLAYQIQANL